MSRLLGDDVRRSVVAGTGLAVDRSDRERERLKTLASFRVTGTGPEPEFDAIARMAARLAGTRAAVVTFVDDHQERVKAASGARLPDVPRDLAFADRMLATGRPLVLPDAGEEPGAEAHPWIGGMGMRFYAGLPLIVGGVVVGALAVLDPLPRPDDPQLTEALRDAVAVLMNLLSRRRDEVMARNLTAVVGFDGRFQRVSPGFESILGWSADSLLGRSCLDLVHPDDMPGERRHIAALSAGAAAPHDFESRYRCANGDYRWLAWHSRTVPDEWRMYRAAEDITDRKLNEIALRESEARYRMLADNATDIVSGHDLDGRITYVSAGAAAIIGWQVDQLVGRDAYSLFHPDDKEHVRESHDRLRAGHTPARWSYRLLRKDGGWMWVETHARLVLDDESNPIGIQAATRDMSETKATAEALRAAREHFRSAFDDAPIAMCITAPDMGIERVNRKLCELVGYSEEELLSLSCGTQLIVPEDRRGIEERVVADLARGECAGYVDEQRLRRSDGSHVWARITSSVMRAGADAEPLILTHVEDIGPQRRHAQELERANEAKSEFLSRMSHELRTPLNAVLGFAQLIEADDALTPAQRENLDRLSKAGFHLLNLVNEVLDMSAVGAGQLAIVREPVSTGRVVGEALDMLRPLAERCGVRMHCDLPTGDVLVQASAQRLKQVLLNLIANAVKYSSAGADVTARVSDLGDGRASLEVIDTGPGIAPDQVDRAFVPFERLGSVQDVEGTGLGLPLSRNLVEAMEGTLTVESTPAGSTFRVDLAVADPDAHADAARAAAGTGHRGDGAHRRLLYIEDNESNVALLARLAERRGDVELYAAARGDSGLELARQVAPDVIVLDMHLPDTTGDVVLERLRADPHTCDTPVIVVTADTTQNHLPKLAELGVTAYMTKPLDLTRLQDELDRLLRPASARPA